MHVVEICPPGGKTSTTALSDQQLKIIEYAIKNYKYTEIAQTLKISPSAVRTQAQRIREKIAAMPPGGERLALEQIFTKKRTISSPDAILSADKAEYQVKSHYRTYQNKARQTKDLIARASGRLYCIERKILKHGVSKIIQRELNQLGYTQYDADEDRVIYKLSKKYDVSTHTLAAATVDDTIKKVLRCIASIYPNVSDEVYELQLERLEQIYLAAERRILTANERDVILDEPEWKSLVKWAEKQRKPKK